MGKISFFFVLFYLLTGLVSAQVVTQAQYNHQQRKPINKTKPKTGLIAHSGTDTLLLPFFDDFSREQSQPSHIHFEPNSPCLVNNTYCINPPTIGAATFDGLNISGTPYSPIAKAIGYADSLISRPIDTRVPSQFANTVYLSFYWQPGSRTHHTAPDIIDSLTLQFLGRDSAWHNVWYKTGTGADAKNDGYFRYEQIQIDTNYQYRGFRFRFRSFGRLSGNFDLWSIDYLYIDFNRNPNDPTTEDVAMAQPVGSALKTYWAIPYQHFFTEPNRWLQPSVPSAVRNQFPSLFTLTLDYFSWAQIDSTQSFTIDSVGPAGLSGAQTALLSLEQRNVSAPVYADSITFAPQPFVLHTQMALRDDPFVDFFVSNDSAFGSNSIEYHFAYDDGTAELARGVPGDFTELAVKYHLPNHDTLTAIDIQFSRALESFEGRTFDLRVWKKLKGIDGNRDSMAITRQVVATYSAQANGFTRYKISPALMLDTGTYYIGWRQTAEPYLFAGCDQNTSAPNTLYTKSFGAWSVYTADSFALMVRPVFGPKETIGSTFVHSKSDDLSVFPNPIKSGSTLNLTAEVEQISLFSIDGKMIFQIKERTKQLEIQGIKPGIYFLRSVNNNGVFTHKLMVE